jgi:hypothetical protein
MTRKIVTVGRYGQKIATVRRTGISRPIWAGKIYTVHTRRDGVQTWHLSGYSSVPTRAGTAPSDKFVAEVRQWAEDNGLEYLPRVRHGDMVLGN